MKSVDERRGTIGPPRPKRWATAPLRLSFAGGGTDLPSHYARFGGRIVGIAIDKYVRVDVGDELTQCSNDVARAVFTRAGRRMTHWVCTKPVPPGSGLGSSSAFASALVAALGERSDPAAIAEAAFEAEHLELGRPTGKQDSYLSCMGGMTSLDIAPNGSVTVTRERVTTALRDFVGDCCLLFRVGHARDAGLMLASQARDSERLSGALSQIGSLVDPMRDALRRERFGQVGAILHEHWLLKRSLAAGITSAGIDHLYAVARRNGAAGGKISGAGGSGYLMLMVGDVESAAAVRRAMHGEGLRELSFGISEDGIRCGSTISACGRTLGEVLG